LKSEPRRFGYQPALFFHPLSEPRRAEGNDMSLSVSYELLSFKGGSWVIESIYDNKEVALQEARRLLEGRHHTGVKVIEETYDADTDNTRARIVFSRQKGEEKPRQKSREENEEKSKTDSKATPAAQRKPDDPAFMKYVLILVFSVGGILFGAIALVFWYLQALGGA